MSTQHLASRAADIRSEACAWLAQLESGELKPADLDAFREWCSRSPRHAQEIRLAAKMSGQLNSLADLQVPMQEDLKNYRAVIELSSGSAWRPTRALAASFVLVAMMGLAVLVSVIGRDGQWPLLATTSVGEHRTIMLEDGSSIELNTNSSVSISYDKSRRSVQLLHGEALFSVARDHRRPFVVFTQSHYVEAVGTAFVVRQDDARFEVTVTEGVVQLGASGALGSSSAFEKKFDAPQRGIAAAPASTRKGTARSSSQPQPVALSVGQQYIATVENQGGQASVSITERTMTERELGRQLAWQEGLLEFSNTPLEDVIREVSRYTDMSITISDPQLRQLAFGGLFRTGDTLALFDALQSGYGIHVEYTENSSVQLSRVIEP